MKNFEQSFENAKRKNYFENVKTETARLDEPTLEKARAELTEADIEMRVQWLKDKSSRRHIRYSEDMARDLEEIINDKKALRDFAIDDLILEWIKNPSTQSAQHTSLEEENKIKKLTDEIFKEKKS